MYYICIYKKHSYKPIKITDMTLKELQKEVSNLQKKCITRSKVLNLYIGL